MSSVTQELQQQLQIAYEAIPQTHRNGPPPPGTVFGTSEEALTWLNNYAFTQERIDDKVQSKALLPGQFPMGTISEKLTFLPGRKRALTGREAADLEEAEISRRRKRDAINVAKRDAIDDSIDEAQVARAIAQQQQVSQYERLQADRIMAEALQLEEDEGLDNIIFDPFDPKYSAADMRLWEAREARRARKIDISSGCSAITDLDIFKSDISIADSFSTFITYAATPSTQLRHEEPLRETDDLDEILQDLDDVNPQTDSPLTQFESNMFAEFDGFESGSEHGDVVTASASGSAAPAVENVPKAASPAASTECDSSGSADDSDDSTLFPSPRKLASQPQPHTLTSRTSITAPSATAPESRPTRTRKPTAKQASQMRRDLKVKAAKTLRRIKKPKLLETSQNNNANLPSEDDEFILAYKSSQ
ncbi:hypothetical protein IFR05_017072 [Cadophora sp. M221]|nr:hypothetical protein IFR05_017072 [Cadophora sp. M221]